MLLVWNDLSFSKDLIIDLCYYLGRCNQFQILLGDEKIIKLYQNEIKLFNSVNYNGSKETLAHTFL